jgi:two-component system chemotaxis sensor kinase CheA
MTAALRERLRAAFASECREHLAEIRDVLAQGDRGPLPRTRLDDAFRRAHSLKGAARAVDLGEVQTVAHHLESLFAALRALPSPAPAGTWGPSAAVLRSGLDAIEDMASGRGGADAALVKRIEAQVQNLERLGGDGSRSGPHAAVSAAPPPPVAVAAPRPAPVAGAPAPPAPTAAPAARPTQSRQAPRPDLRARLLAAFRPEAEGHLLSLRNLLTALDGGGTPPGGLDIAFRSAHSLVGAARAVGLEGIAGPAQELEQVLGRARRGEMEQVAIAAALRAAIGPMTAALAAAQAAPAPVAVAPAAPSPAPAPPAEPAMTGTVATAAAPAHPPRPPMRGEDTQPFSAPHRDDHRPVTALGDTGIFPATTSEVRGAHPSPATNPTALRPITIGPTTEAVAGTTRTVSSPSVPSAPTMPVAASLRVDAAALDELLGSAEDAAGAHRANEALAGELRAVAGASQRLRREWEHLRIRCAAELRALTADPATRRLSRWLEQLDHGLAGLDQSARAARTRHARLDGVGRMLAARLLGGVRRVRTVPAAGVFQGLGPMVRELARELGREVDLRLEGLAVAADRLVLEALKDPVMHLLRNAVGHGLEDPDARVAAGKPAAGRVELRIDARAGRLVVTISDDGRGLDPARIAARARALGIAVPDDPEDIGRLIFAAGFSTSERITTLSGRGMGLAEVEAAAVRLQGTVAVRGAPGRGCTFVIDVPQALAAGHLVLLRCRGAVVAIPAAAVVHLHRLPPEAFSAPQGSPVATIAGISWPFAELGTLLRLPARAPVASGGMVAVVLVTSGERLLALGVDGFLDQREAVVKDLPTPLALSGPWIGGVVLEDGTVALVVQPAALLDAANGTTTAASALPTVGDLPDAEIAPLAPPAILVVDDSFTTRTLEKSILEAAGYRVATAVDGAEALEILQRDGADLVVTDIEMPRLDGLSLASILKRDPRFAAMPVVLVTSLDRPGDRERGLATGADAYVVKGRFDQHELLATVRQLL